MDKINSQFIAFFDAEFTADSAYDRGIQEMIQCALIVHKVEFNSNVILSISSQPVYTYTTFVKPTYNKQLSTYIRHLTGIQQSDVDNGRLFQKTLDEIYNILSEYKIKKVFTWGPDQLMIKNNCSVLEYSKKKARSIYNKFIDVSQIYSDLLGYDITLSQHKTCQIMHIKEFGEMHNAYNDAINLSQIVISDALKSPSLVAEKVIIET